MNPGSLLISGMNPSCTRRAASFESVTPSYRRTVKYALMVMILRVTYVFMYSFQNPSGKEAPVRLYHKKVALQGRFLAALCFQLQLTASVSDASQPPLTPELQRIQTAGWHPLQPVVVYSHPAALRGCRVRGWIRTSSPRPASSMAIKCARSRRAPSRSFPCSQSNSRGENGQFCP